MRILYCDYKMSPSEDNFVAGLKAQIPDCEVECWKYTDDDTLIKKLEGVQGLLTANLRVGDHVLSNADSLRVISVDATGYGNINIESAKKNNILVCSMGAYCTEEVADHTMLLTLMLEKNIKAQIRNVDEKRIYDYKLCPPPARIKGKNMVIFGYGRIGKCVAERAKAFGYNLYAVPHDKSKVGASEGSVRFIDKDMACAVADVLVNNMSENPETFEYFGRDMFDRLTRKPILINVGRGSAVNETDLMYALKSGKLRGAGLDVVKEVYPDLDQSPFIGMDNVIITPHMAFYSKESIASIKTLPVNNLVNGLEGKLNKISCIAE